MPKGYVILAEISKDPEGMKVPEGLSPGGLAGDEAGRLVKPPPTAKRQQFPDSLRFKRFSQWRGSTDE